MFEISAYIVTYISHLSQACDVVKALIGRLMFALMRFVFGAICIDETDIERLHEVLSFVSLYSGHLTFPCSKDVRSVVSNYS